MAAKICLLLLGLISFAAGKPLCTNSMYETMQPMTVCETIPTPSMYYGYGGLANMEMMPSCGYAGYGGYPGFGGYGRGYGNAGLGIGGGLGLGLGGALGLGGGLNAGLGAGIGGGLGIY